MTCGQCGISQITGGGRPGITILHCPKIYYIRFELFVRSAESDFLVSGGPTKTWIVGNSLVTITTSGKLTGDANGSCKRCALYEDAGLFSSTILGTGCWHGGWAEIKIRRPSGNTGWMMSLQNGLHPLSLTHPSSLGIPESELVLLAATFSPEGGQLLEDSGEGGVALYEGNGIKEKGVEVEEEYFFSTEVGSFTDITFTSRIPDSHASSAAGHATGDAHHVTKDAHHVTKDAHYVTEDAHHVTKDAHHVTDARIEPVGVGSGFEEASTSVKHSKLSDDGLKVVPSKSDEVSGVGSKVKVQEGGSFDDEKSVTGTLVEDGGGATKLSISEASAIMHSACHSDPSPHDDKQGEENVAEAATEQATAVVSGVPSALGGVVAHVKRVANSLSWSKDVMVTSPVTIIPRPSSYSFSVENLPPLLSYDGGEEFSLSPLLNEGGAVLSEEEQVCAYLYQVLLAWC